MGLSSELFAFAAKTPKKWLSGGYNFAEKFWSAAVREVRTLQQDGTMDILVEKMWQPRRCRFSDGISGRT
jgi:hypothetical protein